MMGMRITIIFLIMMTRQDIGCCAPRACKYVQIVKIYRSSIIFTIYVCLSNISRLSTSGLVGHGHHQGDLKKFTKVNTPCLTHTNYYVEDHSCLLAKNN
jgi:hypothetical protein